MCSCWLTRSSRPVLDHFLSLSLSIHLLICLFIYSCSPSHPTSPTSLLRTHSKPHAHTCTRMRQVEAYGTQLLQLKLEIARRDQMEGGEEETRRGRQGSSSPERQALESRVEQLTMQLKSRDETLSKAMKRVEEESARADKAGDRVLRKLTVQTEEHLRTISVQVCDYGSVHLSLCLYTWILFITDCMLGVYAHILGFLICLCSYASSRRLMLLYACVPFSNGSL